MHFMRDVILSPADFGVDPVDPWGAFVELSPYMAEEAREMAQMAQHYRGFKVGAIVMAVSTRGATKGSLGIFRGANQNLAPGSNPTKVCAEQVALQKASHHRFDTVIGMWVSGPVQPDTQSGLVTPTLHTCGEDRTVMKNLPSIKADTLVGSIHPDKDEIELYRHEVFQVMHASPGSIIPKSFDDPGLGTMRAATAVYHDLVERMTAEESEPSRSLVAQLAITGQLAA